MKSEKIERSKKREEGHESAYFDTRHCFYLRLTQIEAELMPPIKIKKSEYFKSNLF
jgi:hypothetical protein